MAGEGIVRLLSRSLTADSSLVGIAARSRERRQAERENVLLLDCSGSMSEHVEPGRAKIDALREIVGQLLREGAAFRMVAFGGRVEEVASVPDPGGSTPLHRALDLAREFPGVRKAVVVSDGMPDSEPAALAAARAFGGQIDVFYVGPRPHPGEDFLRRLAKASGGEFQATSLARSVAQALTVAVRKALNPATGAWP